MKSEKYKAQILEQIVELKEALRKAQVGHDESLKKKCQKISDLQKVKAELKKKNNEINLAIETEKSLHDAATKAQQERFAAEVKVEQEYRKSMEEKYEEDMKTNTKELQEKCEAVEALVEKLQRKCEEVEALKMSMEEKETMAAVEAAAKADTVNDTVEKSCRPSTKLMEEDYDTALKTCGDEKECDKKVDDDDYFGSDSNDEGSEPASGLAAVSDEESRLDLNSNDTPFLTFMKEKIPKLSNAQRSMFLKKFCGPSELTAKFDELANKEAVVWGDSVG